MRMIKITELYTICDIETNTVESQPNPELDELRYVGFKHGNRHTCLHYTEIKKIQEIINYFPYIIGHNFKEYDKPILEKYGINFYNKVIIDTYQISENRLKSMLYIDLNQGDMQLRKLAERFNLPHKKDKFNYTLLRKDKLENKEYEQLEHYLFTDLNVTDALFQHYYNLFYGFKEYMSKENQRRMCWLINRPGSTAYKCICNMAGLPEEYGEKSKTSKNYMGGYVSEPYIDYVEG